MDILAALEKRYLPQDGGVTLADLARRSFGNQMLRDRGIGPGYMRALGPNFKHPPSGPMGDEIVGPHGPYAEFGNSGDAVGAINGYSPYRPDFPADAAAPESEFAGRLYDAPDLATLQAIRQVLGLRS